MKKIPKVANMLQCKLKASASVRNQTAKTAETDTTVRFTLEYEMY
jgi:hypothetical protein